MVGLTDESHSLFEAHGMILPESQNSTIILLGAPLLSGQKLDNRQEGMSIDLQQLSRRLEWMPSHDSLNLLINLFTATIQVQYNTIVDALYVTSESEARNDDD